MADGKYPQAVLRILMQVIAEQRIELFAFEILLLQAGHSQMSIEAARTVSRDRHKRLIQLVSGDPPQSPDWSELLKAFEGPVQ